MYVDNSVDRVGAREVARVSDLHMSHRKPVRVDESKFSPTGIYGKPWKTEEKAIERRETRE
jgi:hypothetical protein